MKTTLNLLLVGGSLLCAGLMSASQPAINFTRVTTGPIATDAAFSFGCAWGDYDGDGYLDLIVGNGSSVSGDPAELNALYHNNGDGTFTRVTTGAIATTLGDTTGCTWGDYDNDGDLDLFVSNWQQASFHFRNDGNGNFTRIIGTLGSTAADSNGCAWGDYDNDGYLDLIVVNVAQREFLYQNNGNGTFTRIFSGPFGNDMTSGAPLWADYDGDGWLDLFITRSGAGANLLFHNDNGSFNLVNRAPTAFINIHAGHADWGDFDNDGDLDLFVAQGGGETPLLYRNDGNGSFTQITSGSIATTRGNSTGCAWGDFDNDGWLDLFVANTDDQHDFLFHNNGDGTFTRIIEGSIVNDGASSLGCASADYDNDGFLDLFLYNDGLLARGPSLLYHNDGNSNHWLTVKCVGTASNRSGIGAKVRVRSVIGGATLWQLREMSSGSGFNGARPRAHFGLGDATNAEFVRIEWPSGTVQELRNVAVDQILTVKEPPVLAASGRIENGTFRLSLKGARGFPYTIEQSSDLRHWLHLTNFITTNILMSVSDLDAGSMPIRFYRAREGD